MAKKKGTSKLRLCVDFRMLNEQTKRDSFPLPRIDDSIAMLGKARYFTSLDLGSAFWQIPMIPEDCEKTAFVTTTGQYEWTRMPFGLCNATASFQRLMNSVLSGLEHNYGDLVLCYVDDVLIATSTVDELIRRLDQVFIRIAEAGLKCKPAKCHFLKTSITYLGRVVDHNGVHADPDNIAAVVNWKTPTNLNEVQAFLGFANYYRDFIMDFATIASPLRRLTKVNVHYKW